MADEFLQYVIILVGLAKCQDWEVGDLVAVHHSGTAEAVDCILHRVDSRTFRCYNSSIEQT